MVTGRKILILFTAIAVSAGVFYKIKSGGDRQERNAPAYHTAPYFEDILFVHVLGDIPSDVFESEEGDSKILLGKKTIGMDEALEKARKGLEEAFQDKILLFSAKRDAVSRLSTDLKSLRGRRFFGCYQIPAVELPEFLRMLKKTGEEARSLVFLYRDRSDGKTEMLANRPDFAPAGDADDLPATILDLYGLRAEGGPTLLSRKIPTLDASAPLRIAYFLGGRTAILYRAFLFGDIEKNGLKAELYSKNLYDRKGGGYLQHRNFYRIPRNYVPSTGGYQPFKATGDELLEFMLNGGAVGATIGETAFLKAVEKRLPIVAVAELGFDSQKLPGHAFVLCKNRRLGDPAALKGLVFGARRSAGGDLVFLKEFFSRQGLDPDKDVKIIDNIPDDKLMTMTRSGELDGAYHHLMALPDLPSHCREIRKLDWLNPEMSEGLLVFRKDWLAANREAVVRLLRGIRERALQERAMSPSERKRGVWKGKKGLEIEMDAEDMQLPHVRPELTVRRDLLEQMQALLKKYGVLKERAALDAFIDNSLAESLSRRP